MIYQWFVNKKSTCVNRIDLGCWMLYLCNAVKNNVLLLLGVMTEGVNTKSHTGDGR